MLLSPAAGMLPLYRGPLASPVREPDRFLGGADEGLRLVDGLLVFGLGHAVVNNATARLHIHSFVFDERGAQGNAGVHGSISGKIAHGAAIEAPSLRLEL